MRSVSFRFRISLCNCLFFRTSRFCCFSDSSNRASRIRCFVLIWASNTAIKKTTRVMAPVPARNCHPFKCPSISFLSINTVKNSGKVWICNRASNTASGPPERLLAETRSTFFMLAIFVLELALKKSCSSGLTGPMMSPFLSVRQQILEDMFNEDPKKKL